VGLPRVDLTKLLNSVHSGPDSILKEVENLLRERVFHMVPLKFDASRTAVSFGEQSLLHNVLDGCLI